MNWLIENWTLLVVIAAAIACAVVYVKKFASLPTDEQIKNIKEWLLYAVTEAEKELGGGTGKIKLRQVYDAFLAKFPWAARAVSFERFSVWVDGVLVDLRKMLETNNAVKNYVEDKQW